MLFGRLSKLTYSFIKSHCSGRYWFKGQEKYFEHSIKKYFFWSGVLAKTLTLSYLYNSWFVPLFAARIADNRSPSMVSSFHVDSSLALTAQKVEAAICGCLLSLNPSNRNSIRRDMISTTKWMVKWS